MYLNYTIFVQTLNSYVRSKLLLLQGNFKWKDDQLKINYNQFSEEHKLPGIEF